MLKLYLSTVIIYSIILRCAITIFYDSISKNGWFSADKNGVKFTVALCISSIPIFRFFILLTIFAMATHTKEEVEDWNKESKDE